MYGHALALLPKCTEHPERVAVQRDDHDPERMLCAQCAWHDHALEHAPTKPA